MVFFGNEMKCLSNAVHQSCIKEGVAVTQGVLPLVRQLVTDHKIPLKRIRAVTLHQCPSEGGLMHFSLEVIEGYEGRMTAHEMQFQGSGANTRHRDFLLYEQRRDGVVEHLYLQH